MNYFLHLIVFINIYLILSLSLNLLLGYAALLSIAHAAFYGIGSYVVTLLMMKFGVNFFAALLGGIAVAMLLSLLIAFPSLRFKGDFFVLTSLGFQIIIYAILYNWVGLTRGPYGISGIPRPELFGFRFSTIGHFVLFSGFFALITIGALSVIMRSPYGRVLKAIREDELAAESLGKNIALCKIQAFLLASGFAAVAGAIYATYVTYIDPTSFTIEESILLISMVIVGGTGNVRGPLVGAVVLILLPEILRFIRIPDSVAPNIRMIIYGLLLVVLMRFRRQGIAGAYVFER